MSKEQKSWAEMISELVSILSDPSQSSRSQSLARHQLIIVGERMDVLTDWFFTKSNGETNDNSLIRLQERMQEKDEFLKNESSESTSNIRNL
tara:strand:- start:215 stop:490 length:276 start_codon:yes stop_codon:yes gene_type:complete